MCLERRTLTRREKCGQKNLALQTSVGSAALCWECLQLVARSWQNIQQRDTASVGKGWSINSTLGGGGILHLKKTHTHTLAVRQFLLLWLVVRGAPDLFTPLRRVELLKKKKIVENVSDGTPLLSKNFSLFFPPPHRPQAVFPESPAQKSAHLEPNAGLSSSRRPSRRVRAGGQRAPRLMVEELSNITF